MERLLALYSLPYDPAYPVLCYDERPCFLLGVCEENLAMKAGHIKKEHYAYQKFGSASVLACIEPLTGERLAHVRRHRTKKEFTWFMQNVAQKYAQATKIRVVLDNLNTHNESAFYENLPAEEAFALAQRFEFYYTPKSASWLNMIEIEFSALSRQCLDRKISSINTLQKEVGAFFEDRINKKIKIQWQFTNQNARQKLSEYYNKINNQNPKQKNNLFI